MVLLKDAWPCWRLWATSSCLLDLPCSLQVASRRIERCQGHFFHREMSRLAPRIGDDPLSRVLDAPGMTRASLRIDFVSDIVCPWCAIGLASLELALQRVQCEMDVELHVQPFEL